MESNQANASDTGRRDDKDRVVIFDTTLRDGEQCPGATMTFDEKLEVAELLDEMGVDIIEAGFPIASEGDFNRVQEISRRAKNSVICGLARAQFKDIDRCAEAIKPAVRGRIHTFIGTSPLHRKYQMGIDETEVLERVTASVTRARSYTDDVEWSAMDATRTEADFLCRCVEAAIKAGATTVNIPDTVGYATPDEFASLIRMIVDARARRRHHRVLHALPQRSRAGGRQFAGGRGRRGPTGRMRHQRAWRARRQRRAGRDRHGHQDAGRRHAVLDRHRHHHADPRLEARVARDGVPGAVQQGHRRPERLCP